MFRQIGLLGAALALFSMAGGHWAVVQTVAWAEMLRAYGQRSGSLTVAVEQTFDGQHPCELCRAIATAKSKEHRETPATPGASKDLSAKAVLASADPLPAFRTPVGPARRAAGAFSGPSRTDAPPTPPPRRLDPAA